MKFFSQPPVQGSIAPVLIIVILVVTGSLGWFYFSGLLSADLPGGALPAVALGGEQVRFSYTDNNDNEDLIIRSDRETYFGFSSDLVYFSVTPKNKIMGEEIFVQFFFPRDQEAYASQVQKWDGKAWRNLELNSGQVQYKGRKTIPEEFFARSHFGYQSDGQTQYFRAKISFPPQTSGEFWIEALGEHGSYGLLDPWYDSSWTNRKKITIDPGDVAGPLTNFPMLFSVTDPNLRDTANGGGVASSTAGDIVFTDWDNNKIDFEIESYTNTSGALLAWVEVPFMSSTSTRDIYLYYGNSAAAYQPTNAAVWDSNYKVVAHMKETSGTIIFDSTSNANNATTTGTTVNSTSLIGNSRDFDGVNDQLSFVNTASINNLTQKTISAWIKKDVLNNSTAIATKGYATPSWNFVTLNNTGNNRMRFRQSFSGGGGTWVNTTKIMTSAFYFVTMTFDSSSATNDPIFYIDGLPDILVTDTNGSGSVSDESGGYMWVGVDGAKDFDWDGLIDEFRLSDNLRSANWILTEYRNQKDPGSFYSYGAQEVQNRPASTPGQKARGGVKVRGGVKFR